jgi:hypothetical protein
MQLKLSFQILKTSGKATKQILIESLSKHELEDCILPISSIGHFLLLRVIDLLALDINDRSGLDTPNYCARMGLG